MTVGNVADPASADAEVEGSGYGADLKRPLGSFQLFAVSFAFISVAVAIFATYDGLLNTAGPVGIWLLASAAVGQTLVALVVALIAVAVFTGSGNLDNLASRGLSVDDGEYFAIVGGLMAGMIVGLTTLVGFDSAANLAEEGSQSPSRSRTFRQ